MYKFNQILISFVFSFVFLSYNAMGDIIEKQKLIISNDFVVVSNAAFGSATLGGETRTNFPSTNSLVNTNGTTPMSYLDVAAPSSAASAPSAGLSRLFAQLVNGQESLYWIQADGGQYRIGRDLVHTVFNTTGDTLSNGQVVAWTTNMTTTAHHAQLAKANDLITMPAQGVVVQGNITNGGSGTVMWMGRTPTNYLSSDLATLPYGTPLYVSAIDAGKLVSTPPVSPNYEQQVGFVNYNGAMDVRLSKMTLPVAATVFRTWQLWSASNSVIVTNYRAMRTLDYGSTGVGVWTNTINSNNQYVAYCSGPGGAGLTEIKRGLYQVTVTMGRSTGGGDLLSISAEIYIRATNGVETEVTPVAGTSAQAIGGTYLEYIFSLNITNDVSMNVTDSVVLKFKSSAIAGAPVTLYIGAGYLNVPVPSGQFALQSDYSTHTATTIANGAHGGTQNAQAVAKYSGSTTTVVAKVYQWSTNIWNAAICTNENMCNRMLGVAIGTDATVDGMLLVGAMTVTNDNLSPGAGIYIDSVAGEWTQTIPTNSGYIIRAIGYATATNAIWVNPDGIWATIE